MWINHLYCGQAAPAPSGQPDHHDLWQPQLLQVQDQLCKTAKRTNSRFLDLIEATNMTEMVDQPARTLIVPTNQAFENLKEEVGCFLQGYIFFDLEEEESCFILNHQQHFSQVRAGLEEDPDFAIEVVERHLLKEVVWTF